MSEILLQIDGLEVKASEGMTIYEAAQSVGISIPTLCHHEKLTPYGACRICTVEVESAGEAKADREEAPGADAAGDSVNQLPVNAFVHNVVGRLHISGAFPAPTGSAPPAVRLW